ncbi:gluconate 2-dehydrogenase subunit 3 family protein [Aurantibacter crassamenti]|uniref:gluconate 2-dehydrogenase subunit 3 family protein n=1 Tax=Aurantibacter crassamenti TaxID=1837375 RepID=UPI00193984D7|nr:gluconate 2-dehydrogenase subunit 3 family protein [Aurantibacter crassamenti]MBM1105402.1 gluconate 2-dehydrogenase subunit 3 family protein [Aurantibacter crassamenti]
MDRRKALKNMGAALGYTVATPTLLSLVQSCKGENAVTWTPDFLSAEQGSAVTKLVDIILPATDTPSASELQVHIFIDKFSNEVLDKEEQDFFRMSMDKFLAKALNNSGKEKASNLGSEDLEAILASSLKISKEQLTQNEEAISEYKKTVSEGGSAELNDDTAAYAFASNLRGTTIWGYKTSEYVGEKVLKYLPIPGGYVACGDLQELTGGKAWSL